jgi:hypothetical protein
MNGDNDEVVVLTRNRLTRDEEKSDLVMFWMCFCGGERG